MKSKFFVLVLMLIVAVAMIAQTATTQAPAADKKATCPCCEKMAADGKAMDCCKDGKCCGDGKMCARSADGKSCCKEGAECCKDGKCCGGENKTVAKAKKCCGGMCDRGGHAKHGK